MMAPIHFLPGVMIDARTIMLGLAAPFGGIPAAALAAMIAGAHRFFWTGGVGAMAGTTGIMVAALMGIAFTLLFRASLDRLRTGHFLILGLMVSTYLLSALLLPSWQDGLHTVMTAGPPVAVMTTGGILLFGTLLSRERERLGSIEALRTSEAKYRAIFDSAVDAITIIDPDGRLVAFNPAAERMFGHAAADMLGRDIGILMPGPAGAHPGVTSFRAGVSREIEGRRRDGAVFPLDLSIAEWDCGGERRHLTVIMRDVSERNRIAAELQRAKEAAEQANQAKSEFLAGLSHELRSPLNAIIGFADMTRNQVAGPLGDKCYHEWASDICESGQHLLELINEILDHAKAEAGKLTLNEEDVDLHRAVDFCTRMMEPRTRRAGIDLSTSLAPDARFVRGDEKRIRQILLNLISNAVKYTPSGGRVTVITDLDSFGGVTLSVTDTGIGIAESNLNHMFESFWRADNVNHRDVEGTGLGLPLTRRLVELHGGVINLSSILGKGTTATVRLPHHRVVARQAVNSPALVSTRPLSILVVEDDAIIRLATKTLLAEWGHTIVTAANANEALVVLRSEQPIDLLFSDIVMPPGMNGAELAWLTERLRPGIAILLTSGFAGHAVADEDATGRGYTMVAKPYSTAELRKKLTQAMREKDRSRERAREGDRDAALGGIRGLDAGDGGPDLMTA
jgi:PAS domain S-box-containing protein